MTAPTSEDLAKGAAVSYPRVVIKYCTGCQWLLRAAYFGQELLSTFKNDIGEIALQPTTGGVFQVFLELSNSDAGDDSNGQHIVRLWDRASDGGFPETKELKRRVRDRIDPKRNLGHIDKHSIKTAASTQAASSAADVVTPPSTVADSSYPSGETVREDRQAECRDCQ